MSEESPEGSFPTNEPYYPVREERPPRDMKEFDKRSNENLRPYKRQVVNSNYYNLLKYLVIVLGLGVLLFGYMSYNNKFSSDINIPACPQIPECPEISIPACPSNNISCSPTLNCAPIPSNLSINLVNSS